MSNNQVHPSFRSTLNAIAPTDDRIARARELGLPATVEEATAPTDLQKINQEWVKACEAAMFDCPASFVPQFTALMFTGQRLITEARITAQIDGARAEAISRL